MSPRLANAQESLNRSIDLIVFRLHRLDQGPSLHRASSGCNCRGSLSAALLLLGRTIALVLEHGCLLVVLISAHVRLHSRCRLSLKHHPSSHGLHLEVHELPLRTPLSRATLQPRGGGIVAHLYFSCQPFCLRLCGSHALNLSQPFGIRLRSC